MLLFEHNLPSAHLICDTPRQKKDLKSYKLYCFYHRLAICDNNCFKIIWSHYLKISARNLTYKYRYLYLENTGQTPKLWHKAMEQVTWFQEHSLTEPWTSTPVLQHIVIMFSSSTWCLTLWRHEENWGWVNSLAAIGGLKKSKRKKTGFPNKSFTCSRVVNGGLQHSSNLPSVQRRQI